MNIEKLLIINSLLCFSIIDGDPTLGRHGCHRWAGVYEQK